MRLLICLFLSALVTACASGRIVTLYSSDGDIRTCEVSDNEAGWLGIWGRDRRIDDCVRANKAAGYRVYNPRSTQRYQDTYSSGDNNSSLGHAIGNMFQGTGQAIQQQPQVQPIQNTNCTSQIIGNTVYTNCN